MNFDVLNQRLDLDDILGFKWVSFFLEIFTLL